MDVRKSFECVTMRKLSILIHAIGFDRKKIKYNKYKAWRNHYVTGLQCSDELLKLVDLGLMKEREGYGRKQRNFCVTRWGFDFIGGIFNCTVSEMD